MEITPPTTAYDDLIAAGVTVDSHESDLYVSASNTSQLILDKHKCRYTTFYDREGALWFELPFGFLPYWRNKA